MMFSNLGRMYRLKAYEIPEGSRTSKGMNIINILPLMQGEKIMNFLPVGSDLSAESYICMVTKKGVIKRTSLDAFKNVRKTGVIAINIDEDDELSFVRKTTGEKQLVVATKKGMSIRFNESQARVMGRTARGVRAIRLKDGDEVVGMSICRENATLLTVTETGYGRRSSLEDYRIQSRGGKGLTNYRTAHYGDVAAIKVVDEDDDLIIISSDGIIIRIPVAEISTYARPAKGVRVMRVSEDEKILSIARASHDEEEANSHPEEAEEDAADVGSVVDELEDETGDELEDQVSEDVLDGSDEEEVEYNEPTEE